MNNNNYVVPWLKVDTSWGSRPRRRLARCFSSSPTGAGGVMRHIAFVLAGVLWWGMSSGLFAQSAGMICTMQRARTVAPAYADMVLVLEKHKSVDDIFTMA